MEKHFLFILSKPPHGSSSAKESTDTLMATAAFGQKITVLLLNDGLYQFAKNQSTSTLEIKDTAAMLESLPLYGIESIHAVTEDVNDRHLKDSDFILPLVTISKTQISELIHEADIVLNY